MNKDEQNKQTSDFGTGKEAARVVRYMGSKDIEGMIERGQYIEAFTHTQLGIEKILWDKIVGIFESEKATTVRTRIDQRRKAKYKDRSLATTAELIKWAHFLTAINDDEFSNLNDFNVKRNYIIHGHGKWWYPKEYKNALRKGVHFLGKNGL